MLYTKPIEEITFKDVEAFCDQQIAENAYLDYKQDFPKDLEKTLSAFANTFGGIALIGVEANDQNKPVIPLKGIRFRTGLSERVMNIILGNVTPPFFPEIQICQDRKNSRAVVVIRVAESDTTPHAIMKNTRVYLRTGDVNNPEEIADIDKITWLLDKRKKAILLKEILIEKSRGRFGLFKTKNAVDDRFKGTAELLVTPRYPNTAFLDPPKLADFARSLEVVDPFTLAVCPRNVGRVRLTQNGIISQEHDSAQQFFRTFEMNVYGQIIMRESFFCDVEGKRYLPFSSLIACIFVLHKITESLYREIGYWGD